MPLEKQVIPVSLGKGIDTKRDPKQVLTSKLLTLENATLKEIDEIQMRNGFSDIAANGGLSSGNSITSFQDELVATDNSAVYSYSDVQDKMNSKGTKIAVDLSVSSVVKNATQQTAPDSAYASGLYVYAYQDSGGGTRYSVFDSTTNQAIVTSAVLDASGSKPKVKVIGTNFVLFVVVGSSLKYYTVAIATPTVLSSATTVGTFGSFTFYDAEMVGTKLFVAYADNGAKISVFYLDSSLVQSTVRQINVLGIRFAVFGDASNNAWVSYATATVVGYFIQDSSNSASPVLAATTLETISGVTNLTGIVLSTTGTFLYEVPTTSTSNADEYIRKNTGTVGGVIGTPADFIRSAGLAMKAWSYNSTFYTGIVHDSSLQPTYFIVNASAAVIAKIAPSNGGGLSASGLLSEVNLISTGIYQTVYLQKDLLTSVNGNVFTQTGVFSAVLTFGAQIVNANMGNNLHMTGGIVSMYDAQHVVEHGFNLYPEGLSGVSIPSAGGMASGSYQYVATYEWTDAQGQIHRSSPSPALDVVNENILVSGNITNAATGVTNSNTSRLVSGWPVTGTGVAASTKVGALTSTTAWSLTANATATHAGVTLTTDPDPFDAVNLTPSSAYAFTSNPATKTLTVNPNQEIFLSCSFVSGSPIVTVSDVTHLVVGQRILSAGFYMPGGVTTISSISGSTITVNNNATATATNIMTGFVYSSAIAATFTNGSGVITGVSAAVTAQLRVGQWIYGVDITNPNPLIGNYAQVVSFTSTTFTIDVPFASSSTGNFSPQFRASSLYYPGQTVVLTDIASTALTATVRTVSGENTIIVDQPIPSGFLAIGAVTNVYSSTVTVPTLRITEKKSPIGAVSIVLYRTAVNGTVFYRVSSVSVPTLNSTTTDSVTFSDSTPDITLIGNEQLYTTGGVVENIQIPACEDLFVFKNRMIGLPSEDGLSFWYSQEVGLTDPVEFSDLLIGRVSEVGGSLTCGIQMDDKGILFKEDTAFYFQGDGPSPSGVNNTFSEPQQIATDTGCVDKRSVVLMPLGVMYKSAKGIYLLARDLSVRYIGAGVEDFNQYDITSAKLMIGLNEVRFTTNSSYILIYDYLIDQWYVTTGQSAVDSTIFQGAQAYITSAGVIRQETPGTFTDNGAGINIHLITSWFSFAQIQGFQRVYKALLLGDYVSPHTITVKEYVDFGTTAVNTTTITVGSTPSPSAYQYRIFMKVQKCETLQLEITVTPTTPVGEAAGLSALSFEMGLKKGANKMAAAKSYG